MRTTVDLDERALAAARAKADSEGISLGKAISRLIEVSLDRAEVPAGFPMFNDPADWVITDELVAAHRDE